MTFTGHGTTIGNATMRILDITNRQTSGAAIVEDNRLPAACGRETCGAPARTARRDRHRGLEAAR